MVFFNEWLSELYHLSAEMAPYLLLGFLFAGILKVWFRTERITRFMGRRSLGSVTNAALLGVPMPLCSCGVIPTGISFFRNGATKGATTSFLISTPQTGVDSILATYALLGLPFAIIRPLVAFLTGVIGGVLSNLSEKQQWSQTKEPKAEIKPDQYPDTTKEKLFSMFRYGFGELVEDIVKWLLVGLMLAALLSVLIPDDFFSRYIGNQWVEMLIVLLASVPLYVCATGSIPLAAVLLMKGISPGAALVFLMAGPATNIATIAVVGKAMGGRALFVYMASIIGGALLFGSMINLFLPHEWFYGMMSHEHQHNHEGAPGWFAVSSLFFLSALMALAVWNKYIKSRIRMRTKTENGELSGHLTILEVEGMTCNHCKMSVEKNLSAFPGIEEVVADPQSHEVRIKGSINDLDAVTRSINELGYRFKGVKSRK